MLLKVLLYLALAGVGVVVLLVAVGAKKNGAPRQNSLFNDQKVAGATSITNDWVEVAPDKPLKPEGDDQEVVLSLEEPFLHEHLGPDGVRTPDGSIVQPEVQLVDTEGRSIDLKFVGARGRQLIRFTLREQLKGREYRSIRLRADKEIRCKAVYWTAVRWEYLK